MTDARMYEPGSRRDREAREESLAIAGWEREPTTGMWTHPRAGGLHNLKSAERVTDRWIDS